MLGAEQLEGDLVKGPDWAAAAQWQRLTAQWEAASAAYEELCRARDTTAGQSAGTDHLDAQIAAARQLLDELRAQMDKMVTRVASRRTGIGDEVNVATITPPSEDGREDEGK